MGDGDFKELATGRRKFLRETGLALGAVLLPKERGESFQEKMQRVIEVQDTLMGMDKLIGEEKWDMTRKRIFGRMETKFNSTYRPWVVYELTIRKIQACLRTRNYDLAEQLWKGAVSNQGEELTLRLDDYLKIGSKRRRGGVIRKSAIGTSGDASNDDYARIDRVMGEYKLPRDLEWVLDYPKNEGQRILGEEVGGSFTPDQEFGLAKTDRIILELGEDEGWDARGKTRLMIHEIFHFWDIGANRGMVEEMEPERYALALFLRAQALGDLRTGRRYPWNWQWNGKLDQADIYPLALWMRRRPLGVDEPTPLFAMPVVPLGGTIGLDWNIGLGSFLELNPKVVEMMKKDEVWSLVLKELGGAVYGIGYETTWMILGKKEGERIEGNDYAKAMNGMAQLVLARIVASTDVPDNFARKYCWEGSAEESRRRVANLLNICDNEKVAEMFSWYMSPEMRKKNRDRELRDLERVNPFIHYFRFIVEATGHSFTLPQ